MVRSWGVEFTLNLLAGVGLDETHEVLALLGELRP